MRNDTELVSHLCILLVGEDLDDYIYAWMRQDLPGLPADSDPAAHAWRGALLRCLVSAHLYLQSDRSADSALLAFFKGVEFVVGARQRKHTESRTDIAARSISLWPGEVLLDKHSGSGYFPRTDTRLYDQFFAFTASNKVKLGGKALTLARAQLHHPSKPDPQPTLAFLRAFSSDTEKIMPTKTGERSSFGVFYLDTSHALISRGQVVDGQWVLSSMRELYSASEIARIERIRKLPPPFDFTGRSSKNTVASRTSDRPLRNKTGGRRQ